MVHQVIKELTSSVFLEGICIIIVFLGSGLARFKHSVDCSQTQDNQISWVIDGDFVYDRSKVSIFNNLSNLFFCPFLSNVEVDT